jgi:hypothetical protein
MPRCPNCQVEFEKQISKDRRYPDEIVQELTRRQENSNLCLDCLLDEWVAELGENVLRRTAYTIH